MAGALCDEADAAAAEAAAAGRDQRGAKRLRPAKGLNEPLPYNNSSNSRRTAGGAARYAQITAMEPGRQRRRHRPRTPQVLRRLQCPAAAARAVDPGIAVACRSLGPAVPPPPPAKAAAQSAPTARVAAAVRAAARQPRQSEQHSPRRTSTSTSDAAGVAAVRGGRWRRVPRRRSYLSSRPRRRPRPKPPRRRWRRGRRRRVSGRPWWRRTSTCS